MQEQGNDKISQRIIHNTFLKLFYVYYSFQFLFYVYASGHDVTHLTCSAGREVVSLRYSSSPDVLQVYS